MATVYPTAAGGMAVVDMATGNAVNRYGVVSTLTSTYVVVINTESGTHPKSLGTGADQTYRNIPFAEQTGGPTVSVYAG